MAARFASLAGLALLTLLSCPAVAARARVRTPRPSVVDPALRDYGNTEVWPLPASAVGVCEGTLDPSSFAIVVVSPAGDSILSELATRFMPQILCVERGGGRRKGDGTGFV